VVEAWKLTLELVCSPAGAGAAACAWDACTHGALSPLRTPESSSKDGYGAAEEATPHALAASSTSRRMQIPPVPLDIVSTPPRSRLALGQGHLGAD
jgi:hypothetical protein